jgi:hypothetical protein
MASKKEAAHKKWIYPVISNPSCKYNDMKIVECLAFGPFWYLGLWYWSLSSGLDTCYVDTLQLEQCPLSFCTGYFGDSVSLFATLTWRAIFLLSFPLLLEWQVCTTKINYYPLRWGLTIFFSQTDLEPQTFLSVSQVAKIICMTHWFCLFM